MRRPLLAVICGLMLSPCGAVLASPFEEQPSSDLASQRLHFTNQSISPVEIGIGPKGRAGVALTVDRFERGSALVQCLTSAGRPMPSLEVSIEGRKTPLETSQVNLSDGVPAVWISSAKMGRARLQSIVQSVRPGTRVVHRSIKEHPRYFAGIRFARLILISLEDLASLSEQQLDILLATAASGADLVIAAGETRSTWKRLSEITGITVGKPVAPTTELISKLPRVTALRPLGIREPATRLFSAGAQDLAAKTSYGLGSIRVVGVEFKHLDTGALSRELLGETPDSLGDLIEWLSRGTELTSGRGNTFGVHVLFVLALLPLGLWFVRKRPLLVCLYCPVWVLGAILVPAHLDDLQFVSGRAVVVPVPAGQPPLVVGMVDLSLNRAGSHVLSLGSQRVSLDDVRGGGACLVAGPNETAVVLSSLPGAQYRFVFVGSAQEQARGEEKLAVLRGTPESAAHGGILRRRSQPFFLRVNDQALELDTYRLHLKGTGI